MSLSVTSRCWKTASLDCGARPCRIGASCGQRGRTDPERGERPDRQAEQGADRGERPDRKDRKERGQRPAPLELWRKRCRWLNVLCRCWSGAQFSRNWDLLKSTMLQLDPCF